MVLSRLEPFLMRELNSLLIKLTLFFAERRTWIRMDFLHQKIVTTKMLISTRALLKSRTMELMTIVIRHRWMMILTWTDMVLEATAMMRMHKSIQDKRRSFITGLMMIAIPHRLMMTWIWMGFYLRTIAMTWLRIHTRVLLKYQTMELMKTVMAMT